MSFRFRFAADDSDDDADVSMTGTLAVDPAPAPTLTPPKLHTLQDLAPTLPRNISYSTHAVTPTVSLPRRELYDVRMQLMAADDLCGDDTLAKMGLGESDLQKGAYEGGLKSWECSKDLAEYVDTLPEAALAGGVLELGCGTALPSLTLFRKLLQRASGPQVTLTLADYNLSVLQLVTLPNLFLVWVLTTQPYLEPTGDVDASPALVERFVADVAARGITLRFVEGAWGEEMVRVLGGAEYGLVLGSETVYEPATIPAFVRTVCGTVREGGRGLVAAKKMYFGVGGGVEEFGRCLEGVGGWRWGVCGEWGTGTVGRVVLEVARQ